MASTFLIRDHLIEALIAQEIVLGSREIAEQLADVVSVLEVPTGTPLIKQGERTTEMYFVLSGSVGVNINDRQINVRQRRQCVGEMASIDRGVPRSATCVTLEDAEVAQLDQDDLIRIADQHPSIWRELARMLAERLRQRNARERSRNPRPIVFVGSSSESKEVVHALESSLDSTLSDIRPWYSSDIFRPSKSTLAELEKAAFECDFAALGHRLIKAHPDSC